MIKISHSNRSNTQENSIKIPDGRHALGSAIALGVIPVFIACSFTFQWHVQEALLGGLLVFGALFLEYGLEVCLWVSAGFIFLTALISIGLPKHPIPTPGSTV